MFPKHAAKGGYYGLLLVVLICIVLNALRVSSAIDFYPINGDFQAFNPLRRLEAGQVIGRDAVVYLGLGLTHFIFLFYSIALAFGFESINASYFTLHFLAPLAFFFVGTFISIQLGLSRLAAFVFLSFLFLIPKFAPLSTPDNSLLIFRCSAVVFVAFLIRSFEVSKWAGRGLVPLSIMAGLLVLWSPDYGIPGVIALFACYLFNLFFQSHFKPLIIGILLLGFLAISAGVAVGVGSLLTQGHLDSYVAYLGGVKKDQFWYFLSGWFLDRKIFFLSDLPYLWLIIPSLFLVFCFWCPESWSQRIFKSIPYQPWYRHLLPDNRENRNILGFILLSFIGGGYLPQIGGHISVHYLFPLMFFILLWIAVNLMKICSRALLDQTVGKIVVIACALAIYGQIFMAYQVRNFYRADNFFYVQKLETRLHNVYQNAIRVAQRIDYETKELPENSRYFSTYSTIINHYLGLFNPSGVDYIIHALGSDTRARYYRSIIENAPLYVGIVNQENFGWGKWNKRMDWSFFRYLYQHYEMTDRLWYLEIFKRRAVPLKIDANPLKARMVKKKKGEFAIEILFDEKLTREKSIFGEAYINFSIERLRSIAPLIGKRSYVQVLESVVDESGEHRAILKYGLGPSQNRIMFEIPKGARKLFLRFRGFPVGNTKLELEGFEAIRLFDSDSFNSNAKEWDKNSSEKPAEKTRDRHNVHWVN